MMDQNPSQIKPNPVKIKPNPTQIKPNPTKSKSKSSQNQIQIQIKPKSNPKSRSKSNPDPAKIQIKIKAEAENKNRKSLNPSRVLGRTSVAEAPERPRAPAATEACGSPETERALHRLDRASGALAEGTTKEVLGSIDFD